MARPDLRAVNLNLLAAFDALIQERNVTRAASQMDVTHQPLKENERASGWIRAGTPSVDARHDRATVLDR